jgi:hypothetical protein
MSEVSKVGKTEQTVEVQNDTQTASLLKRSGNITIETNREQKTVNDTPPSIMLTKTITEDTFNNAKKNLQTQDLANNMEEAFGAEIHIQNEGSVTKIGQVENDPVSARDTELLSTTTDDAKNVAHEDNLKKLPESIQGNVTKLVKSLDSTLMKDSVYKKAEAFGKSLVENMDPKSKLAMEFTLKSTEEIKNDISATVFGLKDKYHVPFQKAMDLYDHRVNLKSELPGLRAKYLEIKNTDPVEGQKIMQEFWGKFIEIHPNPSQAVIKRFNNGLLPTIMDSDIKEINKPNLYDFLPKNKQVLVDKIMDGMSSASPPNKVNQLLDKTTLSDKQQEKLQDYLAKSTHAQGGNFTPTVDIPSSIEFGGKTYNFDKLLGGGGDGIAFLMTAEDGKKVVVKAPVYELDNISWARDVSKIIKKEAEAHIAVMGDGHENILGLKGVLRSENCILTVTEFAKGGELNEVVDKVRNSPISDENKNLLKLIMSKEAVQGLQFMQTERNMSHYDVKPGNFFVGENGQVKLADFGRSGVGHNVQHVKGTPIYTPAEAKDHPSEKIDTYSMGISLDSILNNTDYSDFNVNYQRKDDTSLNKLVSAMTSDNPQDRPTLTAVLEHSVFNNPVLNNPEVKEKAGQLLNAIMEGNHDEIARLNTELKEVSERVN